MPFYRVHRVLFAMLLLPLNLLALHPTPANARQTKSARNEVKYGDVDLTGFSKLTGRWPNVTVSGPNSTIEMPDKRSGTTIRIKAATIVTRGAGEKDMAVDMTGNLRYRLVQKIKEGGERTVEGTAGHGSFRRATQLIELDNGVNATLRDDVALEGPGSVQGGKVTVDLGKSPYRYAIAGAPSANAIQFTPRPRAKKKEDQKPPSSNAITAHHFSSGALQIGEVAQFSGAQTVIDLKNATEQTTAQFKASDVSVSFTEEGDVAGAEAVGTVRYLLERPAPVKKESAAAEKKLRQNVKGSCGRAAYDADADNLTLQGEVRADITDPTTLVGPARLWADRVIVHQEAQAPAGSPSEAAVTTTSYRLTGSPERTRLRFTPRPHPKQAKKPAAVTAAPPNDLAPTKIDFAVGDVEIARFESGAYLPGKNFDLTGSKTVLGTQDKKSGMRTQFQAGRIQGTFDENSSLANVVATALTPTGTIAFYAEQPAPLPKTEGAVVTASAAKPAPSASRAIESVSGTAKKADFTNTGEASQITLYGHFEGEVRDPQDLEEPGRFYGEEGDSFTLDMASTPYNFTLNSPKETAVLKFVPREKPQTNAAKPKPGVKGKKPASKKK